MRVVKAAGPTLTIWQGGPRLPSPSKARRGPDPSSWAELLEEIRSGSTKGMAEAWSVFEIQIRNKLRGELGNYQLADRTMETFIVVLEALQNKTFHVRDPDALRGLVGTIVHRKIFHYIAGIVVDRKSFSSNQSDCQVESSEQNPEILAGQREKSDFVQAVLAAMRKNQAEVLRRFYLAGQTKEQIQKEMGMTPTSFRLLKSRSLKEFIVIGRRLQKYPLH